MAISKIRPRHASEGRSIAAVLKDRIDYDKNPDKTKGGLLVSSYQCSADTAWQEFALSKQIYEAETGRKRDPEKDVISYLIIQSFKPGEISPEDANKLGYQLALEFTGGQHQFLVATHVDKRHTMMDSFKKSVISGDMSKIYGNSKYVLAVYSEYTALNVGDKVKIGDEELEIGCVVSEGVGSVSGSAVVVCSEETYTRLTGEQDYAMVGVVLEKDVSEMAVNKIYDLAEGNIIADSREKNSEVSGSYWVFRIAAYSFLAIISLITILNIMNSVSMGVSARIKQYGVMRAVGMGSRQVTKMIAAEAATYSFCGTVAGVVFGLLLHHLIYVKVVITHFGGIWKIPFTSIAIILLLVVFSCVVSVYAPAKRIRNMAITETINEL